MDSHPSKSSDSFEQTVDAPLKAASKYGAALLLAIKLMVSVATPRTIKKQEHTLAQVQVLLEQLFFVGVK